MEENKPIKTFRDGAIGASIWLRSTRAGVFYDVTFSRSYRNEETGESGYSLSFSDRHLLTLRRIAKEAESWIDEKKQSAHTVTIDAT